MSTLRGLSLWQPWASLIAVGAKRVETRSWQIGYRGLLAIHATKVFQFSGSATYYDSTLGPLMREALRPLYSDYKTLPLGAIVAVADLVGCFRISRSTTYTLPGPARETMSLGVDELAFGDYTPGRFGWVLGDVQRLSEPIPCRGARGLWAVPDDVVERVRDQGVRL